MKFAFLIILLLFASNASCQGQIASSIGAALGRAVGIATLGCPDDAPDEPCTECVDPLCACNIGEGNCRAPLACWSKNGKPSLCQCECGDDGDIGCC